MARLPENGGREIAAIASKLGATAMITAGSDPRPARSRNPYVLVSGNLPRANFWISQLPYSLVFILTILGVAYTTYMKQPVMGYWAFLAPVIAVVCVGAGWRNAGSHNARSQLIWTQALHWIAFLMAMSVMFLPGVQHILNANATGLAIPALLALGTFTGVFLVLGKAICELAGVAERRTVDAAGARVEQIDKSQPQGAANDRGCAIAVGQRIEATTRSDLETDRPVDDRQDGAPSCAGRNTVQKKFFVEHGLPCCCDHGKVHGQTTGHDGIDGELLGGDRLGANRLDTNELVRRHQGPFQASFDGCLGRGHYRQAIGPAVAVIEFLRRGEIVDVVSFGPQCRIWRLH